jgi:hypothetical protein
VQNVRGGSQRFDERPARRIDHREPRARIAQEMLHLVRGVGGVDGNEYRPDRQARDVEQHRLDGFFHLHRHAIAGLQAELLEGGGKAGRLFGERRIGQLTAFGRHQE